MAPTSYACRYCKKPNVARSLQGLRSHISQSAECRARQDEEHALLNHNRSAQNGVPHTHQQPTKHRDQQEEIFEDNVPCSEDNTDNHRSKRARVDDDNDDNDGVGDSDNNNDNGGGDGGDDTEGFRSTSTNFIVDYPAEARAGAILEDSQDGLETRFEKIERTHRDAGKPAWAPFNSLADWELSRWLVQSGVSQREIDKFLKLDSVCAGVCCANFVMLNLHQDSIRCLPICSKQACVLQEN